jgi:HTH-type transcriptional regulator, transcriptional repressor of NAD biosynthesis genes
VSRRFRSGLVVGKFAPLHRGHELLIRQALDECERVFLLSWSKPELPGCEPERRARWAERLFPETERVFLTDARLAELEPPREFSELPRNDHDAELNRRFCAWICERVWRVRVEAVFASDAYAEPFARELSRCFRASDPAHPGVTAVVVDRERIRIPITGSRLRADPHENRRFLAPEVYADFVKRVALLGGESTGKSSLAAALAAELGTLHVAEFGRELWELRSGGLEYADMLRIAEQQIARERAAAAGANEWLVCDTTPLTTLFYSHRLFGRADPLLEAHAARRYELVVLCAPDFPFVQDGTRRDDAFRRAQDAWYREQLGARGVEFVEATGDPKNRVAMLSEQLRRPPFGRQ